MQILGITETQDLDHRVIGKVTGSRYFVDMNSSGGSDPILGLAVYGQVALGHADGS
jgi:hypothetical protein